MSTPGPESLSRGRRRPLGQAGADIDLGGQGAVHRAAIGDLEQPRALLVVERPPEGDLAVDPIDVAVLRLAFGAIRRVDARVLEIDGDGLERPLLAARVQRE